jgi:probable O-glycosylation ligase (exosortase A-associated)
LGFEGAKQGWAQLILNPGGMNANDLAQLGDNNGVAVGMLMLVPILTTLAAISSRFSEKMLMRFFAVGVLYRAISTYSRGGFLACAALGAAYLFRSQKRVPALIGLVVATLIIVPVLPQAFWDRMNTIRTPDQVSEEEDRSGAGRLHFWRIGFIMANDRPLTGVGFNAYNRVYDKYDDSHGRFGTARSVHSVWFGLLSELGYPGLVLFLIQLVLAFAACRRARRVGRAQPEYAQLSLFAFGIESGLVAFAIGGTFLPFQYTEILWHFIALSIALDYIARSASTAVNAEQPAFSERRPSARLESAW